KYRKYLLLFFSLVFYSLWKWEYLFLMLFSSTIDFIASQKIEKTEKKDLRKFWLYLALSIDLLILIIFKYSYFIYENLSAILRLIGFNLSSLEIQIILPLGISFYTFQSMSYTIDVYRKELKASNNFFDFIIYVSFWPQLIAGPILRAGEVIPQIINERKITRSLIDSGVFLILVGLGKKILIADNLSEYVDLSFSMDPMEFSAFDVWVSTFLFGFQIYFDFSGYSDIAIGSANLLGFHFPDNFNWPYLARNPREFWKRWHISLSSWVRDYIYLPMIKKENFHNSEGGLDVINSSEKSVYVLFITWFIMGLWHGASWNFALWGVYHAFFIFLYRKINTLNFKSLPIISWAITIIISMAGWIPFRSSSLENTFKMYSIILNPFRYNLFIQKTPAKHYYIALSLMIGMICFYIGSVFFSKYLNLKQIERLKNILIIILTFLVLIYLKTVKQFIYFQF
ncbi:MAG: MBOAT family protein, partial [Leptospiraceae bacterium]|nr:MBOAT family protein [Leptospiraceae bacterium]